ncbi:MAG TPA: calcium-binding protein [Solirubrobacteraceae bacterium]|nr:calcium-binding protein [Solirubrobacteraceae bacterium]
MAGLAAVATAAVLVPVAGFAQGFGHPLCAGVDRSVVSCGAGNDRQSPGGGDKVPHDNGLNSKKGQRATRKWPKLSGILWQVTDDGRTPYTFTGGPNNDELNGHHGSDTLTGAGGHDILWGDWDPSGNNTVQRDVLSGGQGNDWLYPSHGKSVVRGGAGSDYVWAYYGKGTIDCGAGDDTARIRTNGAFKTKGCEHIKHFCQFGENAQGLCLSPTGKPVPATRRRG